MRTGAAPPAGASSLAGLTSEIEGLPAPRPVAISGLLVHPSDRARWMNWTTIEPSPTAEATRLTEPLRASPTA